MENNSILAKISSKYIFQNIFKYIDSSIFKYRLFNYSKYFQKRLDIDIVDYEKQYISKFNMRLEDFIFNQMSISDFDKDYLKNFFEEKMKENNLDPNKFKKIIYDYLVKFGKENENKDYYEPNYLINLFSPLLDIISKTNIFERIFTIEIQWDIVEKFKLKNDYREIFEKLNKWNVNYSLMSFEMTQFD